MRYIVLLVVGLILAGYLAYFLISTVSHDPETWHVDPLEAPTCSTPNCFRAAPEDFTLERIDLVSPIYGDRAIVLSQAFHDFALTQRATQHIAGLPTGQHMTYVQRTERLQMPDYVSVKFIDLEDGRSTVAMFSRSRFGYGDLGANEARVRAWLEAMEPFEVAPGG